MSEELVCYRCAAPLESLTLPISRQDQCPSCHNYLHVCRMCERYAADVVTQCTEDDAEEVFDKEKSNFCDWYVIAAGRFDDGQNSTQRKAQSKLDSLFGDAEPESGTPNSASSAAEDLFK